MIVYTSLAYGHMVKTAATYSFGGSISVYTL